MAKKVRRVRRKKRTGRPPSKDRGEVVPSQKAALHDSTPTAGNKQAQKNIAKLTPEEELREEYSYVVYDLRRIAILAAAMFALLILLNILL